MVVEPRKIVLTSLFVGALAIAAYISQSDKGWLPTDELGLERDNASHATRGDTITGSVSSGPVVARSDSAAAIAGDLQAARNSLQRNDLVSAQAQLDAVRSAHRNDDQVLALQREVEARAKQTQHAQAVVHGEKPAQRGAKSARSSATSSGKTGRSHESYVATREHSNRASSSYSKTRHAPETAVADVSAGSLSSGRTSGVGAPAGASPSSSVPAEVKVLSNVISAPAVSTPIRLIQPTEPTEPASGSPGPQAQLTPPAIPATSPPQLAPAASTLLKSESGPKTRAQVRSEIARARADGSLPTFGNPDPAGPGGAPSMTGAPRP
ncbi:hypothetical protein R75461_00483 [Paraburkholderia nemoris]|uniref:DUF4148 domain-containing protein n=1 Tax=Paraburkholderia nemoris TaxID=2793076 RepID=UPI00190BD0A8|nr:MULTISPECIES: DUF4148 domain-containing protein [Paraburkholderia]MBK3779351.1 DUF4148 domain-containing protein [Paraburkholderia aspalathi]MBK5147048.1 DUF4148 domain-containing protein [Burkholderia sp. R-69608]CAE6696324.1 hypothetical protein R75461_00483 [Paraburkholderia nemoris]CAE6872417.1 hypothetical protein R69608_01065 [Paraburkholderia nemoris]